MATIHLNIKPNLISIIIGGFYFFNIYSRRGYLESASTQRCTSNPYTRTTDLFRISRARSILYTMRKTKILHHQLYCQAYCNKCSKKVSLHHKQLGPPLNWTPSEHNKNRQAQLCYDDLVFLANGMWEPSIAPTTFGKPHMNWKWSNCMLESISLCYRNIPSK